MQKCNHIFIYMFLEYNSDFRCGAQLYDNMICQPFIYPKYPFINIIVTYEM